MTKSQPGKVSQVKSVSSPVKIDSKVVSPKKKTEEKKVQETKSQEKQIRSESPEKSGEKGGTGEAVSELKVEPSPSAEQKIPEEPVKEEPA